MIEHYTPRAYQKSATAYIESHPRCALWMDMGMGKTLSTLTALTNLHFTGEIDHPVLVVAPLRVARSVWPEEIARWQHLKNVVAVPVLGSAAQREEILRRYLPRSERRETRLQVFTINYENLPWLVDKLGDKWPFRTVVADESTKLKGFRSRQGTARARALGEVSWPTKKRATQLVDRFVELTGTPAPNGLQDLWGQAWFLDRGQRLGNTFTAFESRWFQKGFDGFSIKPLSHAQREIESLLKDRCLRVDAKDYFNLEEPIVNTIYIDLPPAAMKHYRELEKQMYTELKSAAGEKHEIEAFSAAALTLKCLQMASGALYVGENNKEWVETHDAKIEALREVVEEASGAPVLVAYHFRSDLHRLLAAFPKAQALDKDPRTIDDWNAGRIPVLLAHPASAGHGINLQYGGHRLVFFSHWWDLEQHQQIIERIGPVRQLQASFNRPVFIHHIVARGTIDELVMQRLSTKRDIQDLLLGAMKK